MAVILLAWALALAVVSIVAIVRRPRAPDGRAGALGRVLLVRPCTGDPRWLADALATLPRHWPADARVLFTVADADDVARPLTQAAAAALRGRGIDADAVVATSAGCNRKVTQLVGAIAAHGADRDVLVVADADVDLDSLDFAALGAALGPGVAACWVPPVELEARSLADRASRAVLTGSLHAFPLLAGLDPDLLVGKVFAVRSSALARAGGLAPMAAYLGEDAELARRLRAGGDRIAATREIVRSFACGRGWREVFDRYVRWALVLRSQRRTRLLAYPLLFAATPLVITGALALGISTPSIATACALAIASRLAVALVAARRCERGTGLGTAVIDSVLADGLLLAAFMRACLVRRVRWRDRSLRLDTNGRLQPSPEPAQHEPRKRVEQAAERALQH